MAGLLENDRLKYYSRQINGEGTLHILLVSTNQSYLEQFSNSISITRDIQREKRSYNLKIHTCKTIIDVLQYMPSEFYVDYIVFILDTHIGECLTEVENNLSLLDSSFTREKICIVNSSSCHSLAKYSASQIWDFCKQHQFNLINGNAKEQHGMFNISKRILNLAEACSGILNGFPMLNIV